MSFTEAKNFVMPWGKFAGKKLDEIAATDDGLLYLDWLAGRPIRDQLVKWRLTEYLADKTIQAELTRVVASR